MATLSGSTIASTYDQLLALPSGGLNGATLVALTDGNASATCALSVATTSIAISATDKFYLDDGSNTYIYESAADIMDFYAGGVHLLSLDDANSEVVINEGSADVNFRVEGNGDANLLFCDAGNDRIGIGTAAPGALLNVAGSGLVKSVIGSTNAGGVHLILDGHDTGLLAEANKTCSIQHLSDGRMHIKQASDGGANELHFGTNNTLSKMVMDASGNLGIGTTAPSTMLEISGVSAGVGATMKVIGGDASEAQLYLVRDQADNPADTWRQRVTSTGLHFERSTSYTATLSMLDGGNVGIGTATPAALLHLKSDLATSAGGLLIESTESTDTDAAPEITLWRHADTDDYEEGVTEGALGIIRFRGVNESDADVDFASIEGQILDSSTNEDGMILFNAWSNNANNTRMCISGSNVGIGVTDPNALLELDQGGDDDEIMKFVSSDVTHGITDISGQADVYAAFKKTQGATGGLTIRGFKQGGQDAGQALKLFGYLAEAADTTKATTGTGVVQVNAGITDGGAGAQVLGSDGNVFAVRNYGTTAFIVDAEGDVHCNGGIDDGGLTTAESRAMDNFDEFEDAHLVRAFDISKSGRGFIDNKFDEFVEYNHEKLAELKLVGRDDDGTPNHFINVTGMQRLHNGAIWQQYTELQKMKEMIYETMVDLIGKENADSKLKDHDIKLLNENTLLN